MQFLTIRSFFWTGIVSFRNHRCCGAWKLVHWMVLDWLYKEVGVGGFQVPCGFVSLKYTDNMHLVPSPILGLGFQVSDFLWVPLFSFSGHSQITVFPAQSLEECTDISWEFMLWMGWHFMVFMLITQFRLSIQMKPMAQTSDSDIKFLAAQSLRSFFIWSQFPFEFFGCNFHLHL